LTFTVSLAKLQVKGRFDGLYNPSLMLYHWFQAGCCTTAVHASCCATLAARQSTNTPMVWYAAMLEKAGQLRPAMHAEGHPMVDVE
jgi:hypothetical protein